MHKAHEGIEALSHLFAQGSFSTDLLQHQREFRRKLIDAMQSYWAGAKLPEVPVIVYAIPSSKAGPLWKTMYGFSAVNFVTHINRVRQLGFDVAVCKISETKLRLEERKPVRNRSSRRKRKVA